MALALCAVAALLVLAATARPAHGADGTPAWCHSGDRWLGYADGIPGSANQDEFAACLHGASARGEVVTLQGWLFAGGAALRVGSMTLYWPVAGDGVNRVTVTAFEDRVEITDACGGAFELRGGRAARLKRFRTCDGLTALTYVPRLAGRADFSIFVFDRQFVAVGSLGWYHIVLDRTGSNDNPTPRAAIELHGSAGRVWVSSERDDPGPAGGRIYHAYEPLAGAGIDWQQHRVLDWETRVRQELIGSAFDYTAYYLLPDRDAYRAEQHKWLAAIGYDLYGHDAQSASADAADSDAATRRAAVVSISRPPASATRLLHEIAHIVAGTADSHGGSFAASLLLLWERYIPDFDTARALGIAERYSVVVGVPGEVAAASDRTRAVLDLFAKAAPILPSDPVPIAPDELVFSLELRVGTTYKRSEDTTILTTPSTAICVLTEEHANGATRRLRYLPRSEFTIGPGQHLERGLDSPLRRQRPCGPVRTRHADRRRPCPCEDVDEMVRKAAVSRIAWLDSGKSSSSSARQVAPGDGRVVMATLTLQAAYGGVGKVGEWQSQLKC